MEKLMKPLLNASLACLASLSLALVSPALAAAGGAERVLSEAYRQHKSNFVIEVPATVSRLLPDDTNGSRHQRFLIRLSTGLSVLVAHNIDLAPRVADLRAGQPIVVKGEYEWNAKGGVLHWTHRDPARRHPGGYIRYKGKLYQ